MEKVIASRFMAAVLVALGMLMGLLTPTPQKAQAQVIQRSFTFSNASYRYTALDLHIRFSTTVTEVVDPDGQVPFRDPDGNLQVNGLGSNKLYFWGNPGVPARDDVTITFRFGGSNPRVLSSYFTYDGLPPKKWASNGNILEAEGLLSQALKAAKNEKVRERLKALSPTPLSNLDTLMDKDVPGQINDLAKLAKDTGDPAADFLAKAAAIVEKVIVKAGVSDAVTASPEPAKPPDVARPQPGPAPTATPSSVEPGKVQTGQGPSVPARDADIGRLIAEVLEQVGKDGVITVEESRVVRYEPVLANNLKGATTRPTLSTISVASVRPGYGTVGYDGKLYVWKTSTRKHFRIWNEGASEGPSPDLDVYVDGELWGGGPIPVGQCRDVEGTEIYVTHHQNGATVSVSWENP